MKKQILLTTLVLISFQLFAQQNFVNVINSEITPKNKHFFQQQVTSTNIATQFNATYDYGLGKGFEFGANIWLMNIKYKPFSTITNTTLNNEPIAPTMMLNGAKLFNINENHSVTLGGQYGSSLTRPSFKNSLGLTYINYKVKNLIIPNSILVLGSFYNSKTYGGNGNRFGTWIGLDFPISKQFSFVGESILGSNYISTSCIGIVYSPKPHLPLTFAVQLPNNHNTITSFVFELTILPKN